MEKEMAKEKLYQVILDLETELAETQKQIQDHEDEILQAKRYLQSLYEKEDTDVMIFSPRNIESRYKDEIARNKEQIRAFEKENQAFYHKQNVIKKRISVLRDAWQHLEEEPELSEGGQSDKSDINVNYNEIDRAYAHWAMMQRDKKAESSADEKEENSSSFLMSDVQNKNESEIAEDNKIDMLHIVHALDNDRKRIASDLHDTIVQDLVHTIHMLELCGKYMDQDSVRAKLELASIEKYLRETIQKARNFISDLRPMIFDDLGFRETLLNAVEDLQKYTSMMIITDVDEFSGINNEKCIVLYRVAMELLRNAIFHSGGDRVTLTLKRENDMIELTVADNGSGFSLQGDEDKHFGLELVKERTYLMGGTFHIDSTGQGTRAQIVLKE
ncbi:MAG: sensor histidine kinase [Lachnospiraceae bacterium]|nr:sensor histidine kinase [Lachnospiraceae bacterium]